MKTVSIIIPMYNSEQYISDCIKSVINQTYKNLEILIINDGSTDQSLNICKQYAIKDDRIKLIDIENSGVSTARNIGIENSTGEYITFVDSDDWLELNMIELAVKNIVEKKVDIVMWSFYRNFPTKQIESSFLPFKQKLFEKDKDILFLGSIYAKFGRVTKVKGASIGTVWCKLYKSDIIKKNQLSFNPDLTRAQDVIFSMNAFNYAKEIYYFDERLYHYRLSDTSTTSGTRFIENTNKPFDMLLSEFKSFIKRNKLEGNKAYYKAFYARAIQVLTWHLDHYYFHRKYQNNLREMKKQLKTLMMREPYHTALKKVDISVLSKKEKLMVILFRKGFILVFYLLHTIHLNLQKNKNSWTDD